MNNTAATARPALIAVANTYGGFAIGIVSQVAYKTGRTYFEVVRMDRNSKYVTITRHSTEAAARKAANATYKGDMAAMPASWKRAA